MENGPTVLIALLMACVFLFFIMLLAASAIRVVPEARRLSIFRLGRYIGERGPGLVFLIPMIDRGVAVDVKDQVKLAQEQAALFGAVGETRTPVFQDGTVEIAGQMWDATCKHPLAAGRRVRVRRVYVEVDPL